MLTVLLHCFLSKTDESTDSDSIGFLLPVHENFHQSFVVADCESQLFREPAKGLEGGSFFLATILGRKEAKVGKGKDSIDALKDFILLKSDGRFCQYFVKKYNLDPETDQTPDLLKTASSVKKVAYLHGLVEQALRELLPFFRECRNVDPQLCDHPLQEGRRPKFQPACEPVRKRTCLEQAEPVCQDLVEKTVQQLHSALPEQDYVEQNMERVSLVLSATRSSFVFCCKVCGFQSRYKTVCFSHVQACLTTSPVTAFDPLPSPPSGSPSPSSSSSQSTEEPEKKEDQFWNYKTSEFFLDAIFSVTTTFEKFGDGLGCFIINKILLPIFHGLGHKNYSNSVHRYMTRILCEATPREALKIIHERFSNRLGKAGHNISRDKRMEYRIGTAKKLIGNLGSNFNPSSVQQVNYMLDIKEELFLKTRDTHGVDIRSGRHNARSDAKDYAMLFSHLTDTRAHVKVSGRTFGNLDFKENLMEDDRFEKAEFYRWIVEKNKEAKSVLKAKRRL